MKRFLFLLLAAVSALRLSATPSEVRGINLLSSDLECGQRAIKAAAEAGINHLQLSHDIVHSFCEVRNPSRRNRANEFVRMAHEAGIADVCIWDHALNDTDYYPAGFRYPGTGLLDLDQEGLWEWIKQDYRELLGLCPEVDGLVLTFIESGARVEDQYSRMSVPERLAKVINTVSEVVCKESGKTLWLRTFAYNDEEYANIIECFNLVEWREGMALMVKEAPHDFFLTHPANSIIGTLGHPTLVEFDACGEYNGQGVILNTMPEYFCKRWKHFLRSPEVVGFVARTSRMGDTEIIGTQTEINLRALLETDEDPKITADRIYDRFIAERYCPKAVRYLKPAFKASKDIIDGTMYIMDLSTTHHSRFRLDAPSTYSRHVAGRWTKEQTIRLGHGIDKELHWWKDLVNTLAPVSSKQHLDASRRKDIAGILDKGWISPEEAMTEEYLDMIIQWTDDCHRKAARGCKKLCKAEKLLSEADFRQLSDCYERSLMCLELRSSAAVCYWGGRIWARGEEFRTKSLRKKLKNAIRDVESLSDASFNYSKPYPCGKWDWKEDAAIAKQYCEDARRIFEKD